jgi:Domain of unknown function (DUF4852)
MRQTNFTILLLLYTTTFVNGQTTKIKFSEPYKTTSGMVLTPGDTLTIGVKSSYHDKFDYLFDIKFKKTFSDAATGRKVIIKHFRRETIDEKKVIIAVIPPQPETGFNAYVDIDNALEKGEIFSSQSQFMKSRNVKLFVKEPLLYFIKMFEKEPASYAKEFVYRFDRKTYNTFKEDEFEMGKILNATSLNIEKTIDSLDFKTTYATAIKIELNEYDFGTKGFPFKLAEAITVLEKGFGEDKTAVYLVLSNSTSFQNLKMSEEQAKLFIQRRKDRYGNVDRSVYVKVNFIVDDKISSFRSNSGDMRDGLTGRVTSLEFYGNKNCMSYDLGTVKPMEN